MKRLLISTTILTLLLIPKLTFSSDLDDFKAAVERYYQALNSMDADTIAQMTHPGVVVCEALVPFTRVYSTPEASKNGLKNWFSSLESLNFLIFNPEYKVVGDTGITWCYLGRRTKRNGVVEDMFSRQTMTFVKVDGKWLLLMNHFSKFPLDVLK